MSALVTIAIPTYDRPKLLERALASVAKQDYRSLEVLVADNASPGEDTARVVESFRESIPGLRFIRHEARLDILENFMFVLRSARGDYFMWLADDDEISPNYVSSLAALLDADPSAAAAAGHWVLMESERQGRVMPTSSYPQPHALARAVRFIWHSDDAFFYALHRTDCIREARFPGYWWPNRAVLHNWAYVYLLDIVLRGRVVLAPTASVQFINHDYTSKSYAAGKPTAGRLAAEVFRRINVHALYWKKCASAFTPLVLPLVFMVSVGSVARGGIARLARASGAGQTA
jgi:glycosyltransferase involved in cell wall biosynthesis